MNDNISYAEYLMEQVDRNISYSEYVAEQIDKSISYTEYLAENFDLGLSLQLKRRDKRIEKIKKLFF
jgi:hypothetical protein